jgi:2-methylfumaryl-CoA isomerase
MVIGLSFRQWQSLIKATGLGPRFSEIGNRLKLDPSDEGNRFKAREEIAAVLAPWIAARTVAQLAEIFDPLGVCWGPYQTFAQMLAEDSRCSTANPMFREVDQPGIGKVLTPASPLTFPADSLAPGRLPAAPAPRLGAHTDEVLGDVLGLSAAEIGKLHDNGVVAGPQ